MDKQPETTVSTQTPSGPRRLETATRTADLKAEEVVVVTDAWLKAQRNRRLMDAGLGLAAGLAVAAGSSVAAYRVGHKRGVESATTEVVDIKSHTRTPVPAANR